MSTETATLDPQLRPCDRLDMLFERLAELVGQRNAVDGEIVDIVAEIDRDGIWGNTGCKSVKALVAWRAGISDHNAEKIVTVARRIDELPRIAAGLREGRFLLDQVEVVAGGAGPGDGVDDHYADLIAVATVNQLRTAVSLEPKPKPKYEPEPETERFFKKTVTDRHTTYTIRLPLVEAAKVDAGLQSHRDALVADWQRDHDGAADPAAEDTDRPAESDPAQAPFPTNVDAFMSLVDAGWDSDVARRPHGQHTTVIVHLDVERRLANLHLGPLLTDGDRQYLLCDAAHEAWFERNGQVIGSGRATRTISRRLRRALEHRDRCCVVPGCHTTRGLHAHHLVHWEDGGVTELHNLVLVCPHHHRMHHRGLITLTGPADRLVVTDDYGRELTDRSLARPPTTPPPDVKPCTGPLGERADWWWYTPYEPPPPPTPPSPSLN